jgi:hypothetical protein
MRTLVIVVSTFLLISSGANALCGSRGGPAFRKPDGNCASWKEIEAGKCGTPPTTLWSVERGGIGATSVAKVQQFISDKLPGTANAMTAPGSGVTVANAGEFNRRAIRSDGIACTSQSAVASAATCLVGKGQPDCKAAVDQSITKGECASVKAGTEARIEAGSHSFDWVRVRLGNGGGPMWVQRKMVLE